MNEREFSARVRMLTDRLWRISYTMLRNGADCDDALQETLLRAWQNIRSLQNDEYFATWITRILINECKNILRRRRTRPQALPEQMPEKAQADHPELREAILALPLNLRMPLVLHYMEGYSVKEISAMLRLPQTTVNWRLHSARKVLRDDLKKEDM